MLLENGYTNVPFELVVQVCPSELYDRGFDVVSPPATHMLLLTAIVLHDLSFNANEKLQLNIVSGELLYAPTESFVPEPSIEVLCPNWV